MQTTSSPLIESGSSLSTWRSCRKLYHFQYERLLEPKGYSSARGMGTLVHKMVEAYRRGHDPIDAANVEVDEMLKDHPGEENLNRIEFDLQKATAMFVAWQTHWASAKNPTFGEDALEFLDVEGEWSYPIEGADGLIHAGRRDGWLRNKNSGRHYLYELKTAAASGEENYVHRLTLDHQVSANVLALMREKRQVDGVIYDIIFKPMIRQKKEETPDQFAKRFHDVMIADPDQYFKRVLIDRMPNTLAVYEDETREQMTEIVTTKSRYRNTSNCMKFGSLCPFFNLCAEPDNVELEAEFKKRPNKFPELEKANENNQAVRHQVPESERPDLRPTGPRQDPLLGDGNSNVESPNPVSRKRPSVFA